MLYRLGRLDARLQSAISERYNARMMLGSVAITVCILIVAALLGLVVGSFITRWAWRSLHEESVLRGRSHCAICNHELATRDLIPLISWLASRGRCRYCGQKTPIRNLFSELACALAFVGIVVCYGLSLETVELLVFAAILLFLSLIDLDARLIPNGCIAAAIVTRALYLVGAWAINGADVVPLLVSSVVGSVVLGGSLLVMVLIGDKVLGNSTMGGGDIKLFFVAGLYFGWQKGIFLVIVACIVGIAAMLLVPRQTAPALATFDSNAYDDLNDESSDADAPESMLRRTIPFGPSIAAACVITMLAGQPFIAWYLGLLGV